MPCNAIQSVTKNGQCCTTTNIVHLVCIRFPGAECNIWKKEKKISRDHLLNLLCWLFCPAPPARPISWGLLLAGHSQSIDLHLWSLATRTTTNAKILLLCSPRLIPLSLSSFCRAWIRFHHPWWCVVVLFQLRSWQQTVSPSLSHRPVQRRRRRRREMDDHHEEEEQSAKGKCRCQL